MEANFHALSLIALPVLTALACFTFYRGVPSGKRIALGLAAAGAAWFLQPDYFHACLEGLPFTQKLVPVLCIAPAVIFIGRPLAATAAAAVLFALVPALCHQYLDLIHRDWCTGNPQWMMKLCDAGSDSQLKGMEKALERVGDLDPAPHAAGWLKNSEVWPLLHEEEQDCDEGFRIEVKRFWHTWISGLYSEKKVEQAVWYPGGPPAEAASRIELRDVPRTGLTQ
jgi:hypothetical protein